jgi:quaternary ammonium compound-resistance protein SugE
MAAWITLFIAGLLEVAWAFFMKLSEGFTRPFASGLTIVLALASFWLLALAMKSLPLGTAYAIWTGIGAVGAFVVGIVFLGEAASVIRITAAVLIVAGLALMKIGSTTG